MNREAMLRILNRDRATGPVAMADPPAPATCDLPCRTSDPLADVLPPTPTVYPPGPRGRLWGLLDTWTSMDEAAWPEANVKAVFDDIMDIFRDHPEADAWYREWRGKNPEARLC
jgi:hypothetical protein